MKDKKVLLTGGTGFIGSNIIRRLVETGYKPSLILRKGSNRARLTPILRNVEVFENDLLDGDGLERIAKKVKPQIIMHLASSGVYSYTDMDPRNISTLLADNVQGTINFLHATKNVGYELFINTGSCFEYGSSKIAFKEDAVLHPCNAYGMTKVAATLFTDIFQKENKLPIVTVRPFTVYGPGEDERRFITTIIKQCLKGENPTLQQKTVVRDYIFIDDVVDAYLLIAQNPKKVTGEVLNISTGKGMSLVDVAKLVIKLTGATGVRLNIGGFPIRNGEVLSLIGDPTKIKKLLRWEAKYSLEDGLKKTIASLASLRP